jgi:hypothetical protein
MQPCGCVDVGQNPGPKRKVTTVRDRETDLTAVLLKVAGTMFMVPMVILTPTKLITGDVPGMMLKAGLWSMAFSVMIAAIGEFIGWAEGQKHRCFQKGDEVLTPGGLECRRRK